MPIAARLAVIAAPRSIQFRAVRAAEPRWRPSVWIQMPIPDLSLGPVLSCPRTGRRPCMVFLPMGCRHAEVTRRKGAGGALE